MAKNELRKSLFDLERRLNLVDEFHEIQEDMKRSYVLVATIRRPQTVYSVIEESISDWPFRAGAPSVYSYMTKRLYDKNSRALYSNEEISVYYFELYLNLLYWAPRHFEGITDPFDINLSNSTIEKSLKRYVENITYVLEQCNMKVREDKTERFPKYIITKRDAVVDSTLDVVPELSEILLSYQDIRNQHDEQFKKNAIKSIADYLEPRRKSFKGTGYSGLCDNVFYAFNCIGIRHNNEKQVTLRKTERMKLYDSLFSMCLHLIQKEKMDENMKYIEDIKAQSVSDGVPE